MDYYAKDRFDRIEIPKLYVDLVNQVFEIEEKVKLISYENSISNNIAKIKNILDYEYIETATGLNISITYHNPIGEKYNETRTDCEAHIVGDSPEDLYISEVIKPIIRAKKNNVTSIIQKAVVIAKTKK